MAVRSIGSAPSRLLKGASPGSTGQERPRPLKSGSSHNAKQPIALNSGAQTWLFQEPVLSEPWQVWLYVHTLYDAAKTPDWATEGHPQQRRHFRPLLALQGARAAAFLPPASAAASQPPTCPPWTQQPSRGLVRTPAQLNLVLFT
ncbi:Dihydrofolate reductase [Metarhizium robertsii ARSEF 23]|uniref:Dihydrofolate reductase n=1 Tax=Metarhizium robertsii (strain ARSEF 23 / ATCC MYA-3075) TaxID=655844 RepID=A0A0B2XJC0_METRA|nr:Dihydrofolate reductase [Metarhizium robertsii ARSEF 23]KHO11567.1 Dihydrofolate reductase [Metarhizium robertsii ARSEF 23]